MLRLQQMKASISLVGLPLVPHTELLQLLSTKTEIGRQLATWPKLDIITVQLLLDILQWLLVVLQLVEHRKCIFEIEQKYKIYLT